MKLRLILTCLLLASMGAGCRVDVTIEDLRDLDAGFVVSDGAPSDGSDPLPDGAVVDDATVSDAGGNPD